jgi:hypothetical protein
MILIGGLVRSNKNQIPGEKDAINLERRNLEQKNFDNAV